MSRACPGFCPRNYSGTRMGVLDPHLHRAFGRDLHRREGRSNKTHVEATWSQALPNWISARTRACFYEPEIHRCYAEMAAHYGTGIPPARPYKPRGKAKVETAVLLVRRWVIARLRNPRFFSLEERNVAIRDEVAPLNTRVSRHLGASREQLFETPTSVARNARLRRDAPSSSTEPKETTRAVPPHPRGAECAEARWHGRSFAELITEDRGRGLDPVAWIGVMLDREQARRGTRRFPSRLRAANLRHGDACMENVDDRTSRGLDRALCQRLGGPEWIDRRRSVLITGPCGVGKSWLACAPVHAASRADRTVLQRVEDSKRGALSGV